MCSTGYKCIFVKVRKGIDGSSQLQMKTEDSKTSVCGKGKLWELKERENWKQSMNPFRYRNLQFFDTVSIFLF